MKGIVVCPQPRAADAGVQILSGGGNAFDAAVATAFAQMVVDPFMCGLGGMGSFQFYHADSGENGMIDFHARAGSLVTADMWAADSKAEPRSPAIRCLTTFAANSVTRRFSRQEQWQDLAKCMRDSVANHSAN